MWPPYLAKQTLLLISVLSVLFYWLNLSLDSIKMVCGCSSQVSSLHRSRSESWQLILLQYRSREGSAAWHQSSMSSLQVDTPAWWSASAHRPDHDGLSHMWPPNSPDINTEDYALQQRVYHQRQFKTVEELIRAIVTESQKLSQRFIGNSINERHRRLEAVVKNGGGHIEHCNLAWAAAHHFNTIEK